MELNKYEFGPNIVDLNEIGVLMGKPCDHYTADELTLKGVLKNKSKGIMVWQGGTNNYFRRFWMVTPFISRPIPSWYIWVWRQSISSAYQSLCFEGSPQRKAHPKWSSLKKFAKLYKLRSGFQKMKKNNAFMVKSFFSIWLSSFSSLRPRPRPCTPKFCANAAKLWVSVPFAQLGHFRLTVDTGSFMKLARQPHATVVLQKPGDVVYQEPMSSTQSYLDIWVLSIWPNGVFLAVTFFTERGRLRQQPVH